MSKESKSPPRSAAAIPRYRAVTPPKVPNSAMCDEGVRPLCCENIKRTTAEAPQVAHRVNSQKKHGDISSAKIMNRCRYRQ